MGALEGVKIKSYEILSRSRFKDVRVRTLEEYSTHTRWPSIPVSYRRHGPRSLYVSRTEARISPPILWPIGLMSNVTSPHSKLLRPRAMSLCTAEAEGS